MVLAYYGRSTSDRELDELVGARRDGANALSIVHAARTFGLTADGVEVAPADAHLLPVPAIIHWRNSHFVVLERITRKHARIVDPGSGRNHVPHADFARLFSGVAIVVEPSPAFRRLRADRPAPNLRALPLRLMLGPCITAVANLLISVAAFFLVMLGAEAPAQYGGFGAALVLAALAATGQLLVLRWRSRFLRQARLWLAHHLTARFLARLGRMQSSYTTRWAEGELAVRVRAPEIEAEHDVGRFGVFVDAALLTGHVLVLFQLQMSLALGVLTVLGLHSLFTRATRDGVALEPLLGGALQRDVWDFAKHAPDARALGADATLLVARWQTEVAGRMERLKRSSGVGITADAGWRAMEWVGPLVVLSFALANSRAGQVMLGASLGAATFALFTLALGHRTIKGVHANRRNVRSLRRTQSFAPVQRGRTAAEGPPRDGALVSLRRVGFRYAPFGPQILQAVDLDVRRGECLLIVGAPVAGLTTLGRLLLGIADPSDGVVRRANVRFAGVLDDASLIEGTVAENIAWPERPDDGHAIEEACRTAGLTDAIAAIPLGYDTPVLQGGRNVSRNQRWQILFARAVFHRPDVLVVDAAPLRALETVLPHYREALAGLPCAKVLLATSSSSFGAIAQRSALLRDGHIRWIQTGAPSEMRAGARSGRPGRPG